MTWSVLHEAAWTHSLDEIEKLIQVEGIDPNVVDDDGKTPLHIAAKEGDYETIRALIENGALPSVTDFDGITPYDILIQQENEKSIAFVKNFCDLRGIVLFTKKEPVESNLPREFTSLHKQIVVGNEDEAIQLIKSGQVHIETKATNGQNALHIAAQTSRLQVLKFLIRQGIDINTLSDNHRTALHFAAARGNIDCCRELLEQGIDVNLKDSTQETALHLAALNGYDELARLLIQYHANPFIKNEDQKTPLDLAIKNGFTTCSSLLSDYEKKKKGRIAKSSVFRRATNDPDPLEVEKSETKIESAYLIQREGEIHEIIKQALESAHKAIKLDTEENYSEAFTEYQNVISQLESIQPESTGKRLVKVRELVNSYKERLKILAPVVSNLSRKGAQELEIKAESLKEVLSKQNFQYSFREIRKQICLEEEKDIPSKPPQNIHHPFFMMRVILKAIYDGISLSPGIRIPNSVWFQSDIHISSLGVKISCCEEFLQKILRLKTQRDILETVEISKDLDQIVDRVVELQNQLSKSLKFIGEIKDKDKKKSSKPKPIKKYSSKMKNTTNYVETIVHLFENSQFLDTWITHFESNQSKNTELLDKMKVITSFLDSAIILFVLKDFVTLIENYMKKTKIAFFNL